MNDQKIPPEVKTLISEAIDSLETLEILLFVFRQGGNEGLAVHKIAQELRFDSASISAKIKKLVKQNLISLLPDERNEDAYKIDENARALVSLLAKCYAERRVSIINAIFATPRENIQIFADAFKIWKGDQS
jgi:DNA-binding MarR family transcriptional regulator